MYIDSNFRKERALKLVKRNTAKAHFKFTEEFLYSESWEKTAQDRTELRCLIGKGAAQYEARRSCKDEKVAKNAKPSCKHVREMKTLLHPHFYIVKLLLTGVFFFLFALKHRLLVLVRTASLRRF